METEVKRGRGRPKKVVSPEELNKPKLPRGRPRKYPKVEQTEKRPRGRPRTRPVVENQEKRPRGRPRKPRDYVLLMDRLEAEKQKNESVEEYSIEDFKESGIDYCEVDFDNIALAEDFQNEKFKEVSEQEVIKKAEKEIQKDLKQEQIAREKSSAYVKMKKETKRIVKTGDINCLYPAKHYKSNVLEQLTQEEQSPKPEIKLDVSRAKTPLRELVETKSTKSNKTKPMKEKVIVVTGATSGMGLAVITELARLGHIVIGVARKATACREVYNAVKKVCPEAKISFVITDLSLVSQVSVLAEEIADKIYNFKRSCLDVIINCSQIKLDEFELTYENREVMLATNYLSFVMLVDCLMPLIDRSVDGRVITFTDKKSMNKTKLDWQNFHKPQKRNLNKIYEETKLANLMWALEFDHRNRENTSLHSYCVQSELNLNKQPKNFFGKMFGNKFTEQNFNDGVDTATYLALSKDLPKNMVCYENKHPVYPTNKFAINQDNRNALWRMTELELKIK